MPLFGHVSDRVAFAAGGAGGYRLSVALNLTIFHGTCQHRSLRRRCCPGMPAALANTLSRSPDFAGPRCDDRSNCLTSASALLAILRGTSGDGCPRAARRPRPSSPRRGSPGTYAAARVARAFTITNAAAFLR